MRTLRTLAVAAMTASLLLIPSSTAAQTGATAEEGSVPLARQPDGHLPLEGTPWRLEGYHYRDREAEPGPEVASFIRFDASSFEGSGGCSRVRGRYGLVGPALKINLEQLGTRPCAEQLALVQQAVESGLKRATAYELVPGAAPVDDKLLIRAASGEELLRYGLDDLALLDGAEWLLESYTVGGDVVAASGEQPAVLSFRPDKEAYYKRLQTGRLFGSSGCNGIVAAFFRHADVLSFAELERTDAPCTTELAAQEAAMTAVLEATAIGLDLPYDRLILTSMDSGERLELTSQASLEGSTWLLQSPAFGATGSRITLRLANGLVSGEGPCGSYSGAYATDGVFVTFRNLQGARDQTCPELRQEKALLDDLRAAAILQRTSDQLRLLDARAVKTLVFTRPSAP
jgi:heat shock protein HslJ